MSDFMFVMKCLIYTILIAFVMQMKMSGISLESRVETFLRTSQVTAHLQDASVGGARLLQEGYYTTKNFILDSTRSFRSSIESQENKASRH